MRFVLFVVSMVCLFCGYAYSADVPIYKSTPQSQSELKLTVYNNNMGMVKDTRTVSLPVGKCELRFTGIASGIMPVTVQAKSLTYPGKFRVLEQNYEYDLMSAERLLDKYVGKRIKIIEQNKFKDRENVLEATLLSNNKGQIYRINGEIYLGHDGYKVLPEIPGNLIAKPTLMWLCESVTNKPHEIEVSYLTNDISWKADYIVSLNKDESNANVSAWITLDNKSGTTYRNAELQLVAGDVNMVKKRKYAKPQYAYKAYEVAAYSAPQFKEKSFFEYHIYHMQRRTTVKDRQAKQIKLFDADGVKIKKELIVNASNSYFTRRYPGKKQKQPVNVYVSFRNSAPNRLGIPFPAGIMRMYKEDTDGGLQFIGENEIKHTPQDETVKIKIGKAFDVIAQRIQTDYEKLMRNLYESEWEITIRNHKRKAITVSLVEPLHGNWKVISTNTPYKKIDAFTIRFNLSIPMDGTAQVKYRVRVGL